MTALCVLLPPPSCICVCVSIGTLAQIADVFGHAEQNITGLCVRSTVVPELSRVTITCRMHERELAGLKKRLRALVAVTFFHITSMTSCIESEELLLRSHALVQVACHGDTAKHAAVLALLDEFGGELVSGQDSAVIPHDGLSLVDTDEIQYDNAVAAALAPQSIDLTDVDDDSAAKATAPRTSDTLFLHVTHEPAQLERFTQALLAQGIAIVEVQTCGPLFLATSQSTLDTADTSDASFTREVAAEVAKLVTMSDVSRSQGATRTGLSVDDDDDDYRVSEADPFATSASDTQQQQQRRLPTTFELHTTADGYFSRKRLRLHARIAHQLYESVPQDLSAPRFVLLIGIPGAGKSTVLSHLELLGQLPLGDFVNFDVDDVIALLPEFYHAMLSIGLGNEPQVHDDDDDDNDASDATTTKTRQHRLPEPQVRYQLCRDEARFILKKNLYSAIMSRKNIILHGSGKSATHYASVLDQVLSAGFDTHVVCLDIPRDEALVRVAKRSNGYGRDVPPTLVDLTASLITRNFRRLAARVPNAHLFDSTALPPRLVWSKQKMHVAVQDPSDPVQQRYAL